MSQAAIHKLIATIDAAADGLGDLLRSVATDNETAVEAAVALTHCLSRIEHLQLLALDRANKTTPPHNKRRWANPATDIAATSRTDARDLRKKSRLANWLTDFSLLCDAHRQGHITLRRLESIRRLDNTRTHQQLLESEAMILEAAMTLDEPDFRSYLGYLRNAIDPDGSEPTEPSNANTLHVRRQHDGTVRLSGRFDPISGQAIATALREYAQRSWRKQPEVGQRPFAAHLADAMAALVASGAVNGPAPVVPSVSIVVGYELAENMLRRADDPTIEPLNADYYDPNRRCEFLDGSPCHPDQAAVLLAIGSLRTLVLDSDNRLHHVSKKRTFPSWMKQVLLVRARGRCLLSACDAPCHWLVGDHVTPWAKGGQTTLENGQVLCDPDNKRKSDTNPDGDLT